MIHLDTNFLVATVVPGSTQEAQRLGWLAASEPLSISAIAWAEFLCGPVSVHDINQASKLFPAPEPFLSQDAHVAADWFNRTGRRRGSLTDCMIAATAFRVGARVATSNLADFRPFVALGLQLC
jgi:predicted nucleic acid-binding protein